MSTFVLVHPAWFGGWCWNRLARLLQAQGHSVHPPTLTGLGERAHLVHPGIDLRTHVEDIVNVLTLEDLSEVILLGTSSAGMVITGVADRVPERIGSLVYLDAFVPDDGQCLLDLIPPDRRAAMEALVEAEGFGWLLPRLTAAPWEQLVAHAWQVTNDEDLAWTVTRLRPTPFGHFTRAVQRHNPTAERLPRIYIRCDGWPNPGFDRCATIAGQAPGWQVRHLDSSHLPYVTHTRELAQLLHELVEAGG
jgi:pimeloyl-ACP methyl ester carboxylesterase